MLQNKIGICEWSLPVSGPFALAIAAETGFDGIQLGDLGGSGMSFPMNNKRIQDGYLQASADTGVEIQALHLHTLVRDGTMKFPLDTAEGQSGVHSFTKGIEACQSMHIPVLMLSSFFATLVQNDYDFDVFSEHLKLACKIGRDHGVRIVYESVLHIDRIMRLLDIVGDDLKICYDILNPIRWGSGDPRIEIRRIGKEHIDHFHVKDAPHDLKGCCLLNAGRGDFQGSVAAIRDIGFSGWYITENYYSMPPMCTGSNQFELAKQDAQTMRKFLADG